MISKYDEMMRSVNANKELYCHTRDGLSWRIEPHKWLGLFTSKTKVRVVEDCAGRDEKYYDSADPHETGTYISNQTSYSKIVIFTRKLWFKETEKSKAFYIGIGYKRYFDSRELAEKFIARQEAKPSVLLTPLCHDCGETYTWKMRDGTENTICCE